MHTRLNKGECIPAQQLNNDACRPGSPRRELGILRPGRLGPLRRGLYHRGGAGGWNESVQRAMCGMTDSPHAFYPHTQATSRPTTRNGHARHTTRNNPRHGRLGLTTRHVNGHDTRHEIVRPDQRDRRTNTSRHARHTTRKQSRHDTTTRNN